VFFHYFVVSSFSWIKHPARWAPPDKSGQVPDKLGQVPDKLGQVPEKSRDKHSKGGEFLAFVF